MLNSDNTTDFAWLGERREIDPYLNLQPLNQVSVEYGKRAAWNRISTGDQEGFMGDVI